MPQFYTLEEAARVLQTTPDKVKEMARKNELRGFQDRGNLRFRAQEVDEAARRMGLGSEPDLQLGEAKPTQLATPGRKPTQAQPDEEPLDLPLGGDEGADAPIRLA